MQSRAVTDAAWAPAAWVPEPRHWEAGPGAVAQMLSCSLWEPVETAAESLANLDAALETTLWGQSAWRGRADDLTGGLFHPVL